MTTLTQDQISSAADAARHSILQHIDADINRALEDLGISPADVSEDQYSEIIDEVFV